LKLQVVITDLSHCRKDLTIEIAADVVKAEYDKVYEALGRQLKMPGFRPGRIPRGVINQRFEKEIREQVVNSLLPHALEHAMNDRGLHLFAEPKLTELSVTEGQPLKATMSLEVMPEFELKEYKGLKATKRIARVTDKDVARMLERFRESAAEFVPIEDRPSQDGDFVSVNLVGKFVEPQEEEELKADDVQIELGAEGNLAGFTENLRGVKSGDLREFRIKYPEDYVSQDLRGKTLDFTATVVAVRQKELPAIDDEFAKDLGQYRDLQDLRDKIRKDLVATAEIQANNRLRGELLGQVLSDYDFDVPQSLIEKQAKQRAEDMVQTLLQNGVPEQTIKQLDWAAQMEDIRRLAIQDVRSMFVVAAISGAEDIRINEADINSEIIKMAAMRGEAPMELKARLTKDNALSSIENTLLYQRVVEVIENHAEITVEGITENQAMSRIQSEAAA
jgi:trigger factor